MTNDLKEFRAWNRDDEIVAQEFRLKFRPLLNYLLNFVVLRVEVDIS